MFFRYIGKKYPKNRCIGSRNLSPGSTHEYVWKTYEEVLKILEDLARGIEIMKLYNLMEEEGRKRKILANLAYRSKEEITILSVALWHIGGTIMTDTENFCEMPDMNVAIGSKEDLSNILERKARGLLPGLQTLIMIDEFTKEDVEKAESAKIKLIQYAEVLKKGKENPDIVLPGSKKDDLCGIYTTSGTTGSQKVKIS